MNEQEFKQRTKKFGLRVIKSVEALPRKAAAQVLGKQLLCSATSVGANYRAACRSLSVADILNKLSIVEEEADESAYWMEMIIEADLMPESRLADLTKEADEIVAMTVASSKTLCGKASAVAAPQSKIRNPKSKIAA